MIRSLRKELAFGDQVGRYRLIAELARGGMGIVYLASTSGPARFSKLLALKQLRPDMVEDSNFLTMFLDEARVAARLSHPNIVQTNDVEQSDGRYFIAMEYLDGRSFSQILRRFSTRGGFPLHMSLMVLREVLGALDYAHSFNVDGNSQGVVHRDISPQNIFVTFDGCTKVIDFGIAKAHDSIIETKTGVLKGKVQYMAPEQLMHRAEARSDVFSVGAIMFEVVTGHKLWAGMNEIEIMAHLARCEIPTIQTTLPDVPPVLLRICRTALSPRVEDRYASAAAMREAIDDYLWSIRVTPQSRELGAKLVEEFGAEREASRQAVEAYLADDGAGEPVSLQPLQPTPPEISSAGSERYALSVARSMSVVQPMPTSASAVMVLPETGFTKRQLGIVTAVAVMLLGVLIGRAFKGPAAVSAPVAVAPHLEPAAMSLSAPIATIDFAVSVSPSAARLFIDGQPMPSNPFMGHFPKDQAMHRIRATAPGYLPKERVVGFAENVMVDLSLDPRATSTPAPAPTPFVRRRWPAQRVVANVTPVAAMAPTLERVVPVQIVVPAAAPRATNDITPRRASDAPIKRAIDSSNPYGEDQ